MILSVKEGSRQENSATVVLGQGPSAVCISFIILTKIARKDLLVTWQSHREIGVESKFLLVSWHVPSLCEVFAIKIVHTEVGQLSGKDVIGKELNLRWK
jgi:hypothetical protein